MGNLPVRRNEVPPYTPLYFQIYHIGPVPAAVLAARSRIQAMYVHGLCHPEPEHGERAEIAPKALDLSAQMCKAYNCLQCFYRRRNRRLRHQGHGLSCPEFGEGDLRMALQRT